MWTPAFGHHEETGHPSCAFPANPRLDRSNRARFLQRGSARQTSALMATLAPSHEAPRSFSSPGFVVAWTESQNVLLQRFSRDGARSGAVIQANTTQVDPRPPAIASLTDGNFVVSWGDARAFVAVRAQVFGANGTKIGTEFAVNTSEGVHFQPVITELDDAGFVIAWQGGPNFGSTFGRFQVFNPNGTKSGGEETPRHGIGSGPNTITFIPSSRGGRFASVRLGSAGSGEGNILAAESFGPDPILNSGTNITHKDDQTISSSPAVRALPNGGLVVTWTERKVPTTGIFGQHIKAMLLTGKFEVLSPAIQIDAAPPSAQDLPCVTPILGESGDFVLAFAWIDASASPPPPFPAVKARVFSSALRPV
jgi:hypothetical protein